MATDDLRRYGAVLEELIASKAISKRGIEKALGWGRGTLTKILQGKNELKVGSLLEILRAIDVAPLDFYVLVHGEAQADPDRAPIVSRILKSFGPAQGEMEPLTLPRNLNRKELEGMIEDIVRRLLAERG